MSRLWSQVEKTKHCLLLRQKLESTLGVGQDPLLSESQPLNIHKEDYCSSKTTIERQKTCVAKVSVILNLLLTALFKSKFEEIIQFLNSLFAGSHTCFQP